VRSTIKPNIIVILIDDLGWKDLACCGSEFYETPNLDRLSSNGVRFTQAYAACPVCSPSRAALLTGKSPARLGITNYIHTGDGARGRLIDAPFIRELNHNEITYASLLRNEGYATWHVGKWHLGAADYWPKTHGFDVNIAGCDMGHPTHGYFSPYKIPTLQDGQAGEYLTDRLTQEAINLVRAQKQSNPGQPFLLNMWHYAVHTPIQAPNELVEKYRRKAEELGLPQEEALIEGEHFPVEHKRSLRVTRRIVQSDPAYAAMIENLDTNIGRLLNALDECGVLENSIVVFTSDNGGLSTAEGSPTCNLPLAEGKGWTYDGGTRVALLIAGPEIHRGITSDVPVTTTDVFATILDLTGADTTQIGQCDGRSLAPLLKGETTADLNDRPLFWHYPHYGNQGGTPSAAVRKGEWKLIRFMETGAHKLYNLHTAPGEHNDVAAANPEIERELSSLLATWQNEVGAVYPAQNEAPKF
jgi:arylsulfatase A-like enzyme